MQHGADRQSWLHCVLRDFCYSELGAAGLLIWPHTKAMPGRMLLKCARDTPHSTGGVGHEIRVRADLKTHHKIRRRSAETLHTFCLVGWVVLRISRGFNNFQSFIATWKQEIPNL